MRLSLSDLALRIKIMNVNLGSSIEDVLGRALDPPLPINIQRAVSALVEVSREFNIVEYLLIKYFLGSRIDTKRRNYIHGTPFKQTPY